MAKGIAGDIKREIVELNKIIKDKYVGILDNDEMDDHLKAAAKSLREAAKLI